jgi:hypothetical protein
MSHIETLIVARDADFPRTGNWRVPSGKSCASKENPGIYETWGDCLRILRAKTGLVELVCKMNQISKLFEQNAVDREIVRRAQAY